MAYYASEDVARSAQLKPLSDDDVERIDIVKTAGRDFHDLIVKTLGASREASLAKTKIEEAIMWAVKGITA